MKKIIFFGNFFLVFLLLQLVDSCSSSKPYDCYVDKMKNLDIRWGVIVKDKFVLTYTMGSNGKIMQIGSDSVSQKLGYLDSNKACRILNEINRAMLKVQACMDPGDTLKFLSVNNPETNYFLRTRWNPKFNNENTKTLNKLYENLENYIKTIH